MTDRTIVIGRGVNNREPMEQRRGIGLIFSLLLLLALIGTGCGGSRELLVSTAPDTLRPVITHTALLKTTKGDILLELYGQDAPKTVANFVGLARQNTYDSLLFHRVMKNFMIQGGDPKSKDPKLKSEWGTGGISIYGQKFADELDETTPSYKRGYVRGALAMANSGPNTNSSQFFIVHKDYRLPHLYNIFGYVREGIEVVDAIAEEEGAPPSNPTRILDVIIDEYIKIEPAN